MKLAFALAAAMMFATGSYLLLKRDLVRVVLGVVLVSQSAVLTLIAAGLTRGRAPIHPLPAAQISDPLTQAMALTALVIGLATTAMLLALVYRVFLAYRTIERDELVQTEASRDAESERESGDRREQEEALVR